MEIESLWPKDLTLCPKCGQDLLEGKHNHFAFFVCQNKPVLLSTQELVDRWRLENVRTDNVQFSYTLTDICSVANYVAARRTAEALTEINIKQIEMEATVAQNQKYIEGLEKNVERPQPFTCAECGWFLNFYPSKPVPCKNCHCIRWVLGKDLEPYERKQQLRRNRQQAQEAKKLLLSLRTRSDVTDQVLEKIGTI